MGTWLVRPPVRGVQGPHLTLYLWHLLGELRLCRLGEEWVQVLTDLLLPFFFILDLRERTQRSASPRGLTAAMLFWKRAPHLAVNVPQLFSQLCLCGFRQLVEQRAARLLQAVLLILHLHKDGRTDRKLTVVWAGNEVIYIFQLLLEELDKKNQGLKVWRRSVWILNNPLINQNENIFPLSRDLTWTHHTASVLTWLCSCDTSLACSVSRVSGSFEYRQLDASFFPASLYLV